MADTTMPPLDLAERLILLLGLAFFLGLALKAIYKRDGPAIPGGMGPSRWARGSRVYNG